ncbi:MAG TPA: hypothetical protein VEV84_09165 [Pyrinomonadaceae bacterium]|nr:hypothetical protein [Pyrinomonadaceae bacterium]
MLHLSRTSPKSWLAFELNVLRRLKFLSVALPFTHSPSLGAYLKRWDIRVQANDPLQSAWTRAQASIPNNGEKLSADDVNIVLEDAYVPKYKLQNAALRNWFSETDSWWFDNVRQNIDRLATPISRAIASSLTMATGDYVLSFAEETREIRQPLSNVFRRLWTLQPEPYNNGQNNSCQNRNANEFLAECRAELMFLRLPAPHSQHGRVFLGQTAWREEWLRGGSDFWDAFDAEQGGKLGMPTETKSQYLNLLEETLRIASHLGTWAVAHVENGAIATQDIVETVGRVRRVEAIYTKDFSELTGAKAVIITA